MLSSRFPKKFILMDQPHQCRAQRVKQKQKLEKEMQKQILIPKLLDADAVPRYSRYLKSGH